MNFDEAREVLRERGQACLTIERARGVVRVTCHHCGASIEEPPSPELEDRIRSHASEVCIVTGENGAADDAS